MGLLDISRKNKMKHVHLLKCRVFVQIGGKKKPTLCSDDSIACVAGVRKGRGGELRARDAI